MFYKLFRNIVVLALVSLSAFVFYQSSKDLWADLYEKYFPCQKPIYYTLGFFDTRFGIKEKDFLINIKKAEDVWEVPFTREFFKYSDDQNLENVLKINLVYDYRQEITSKIKALGIVVDQNRASYDEIKSKYELLQKEYLANKKDYEALVSVFQARQDKYVEQVNYWNKKGGAPQDVFDAINAEAQSLKKEFERIKKIENNLNDDASDINALVSVINDLAHTLNINVAKLNNIGEVRGEEFTQGEYTEGSLGEEINVFEFSTKEKLIRLLAHEFGHALGLLHVEDREAIMYRLNENKDGKLKEDDINALKAKCGI
ncbi:matrixin family metalloprotease [Candidatus Nomurabacteria bacterium]|nr:matrixin family metalloprotease [Candidatus Nomurabacteria bacterium]